MKRSALLLIFVLLAVVVTSGCIGGKGGGSTATSTQTQAQPQSNTTVSMTAPSTLKAEGTKLSFDVTINGNAQVSRVVAILKFDGKAYNLAVNGIEKTPEGYVVRLSYDFQTASTINTNAVLKVVAYTPNGMSFSKEFSVKLVVLPVKHSISIAVQPRDASVEVSQFAQSPLTLVLKVSSDTTGKLVVDNVSDSKGFVTGISGFSTFPLSRGTFSYYLTLSYDPNKVLSGGGGEDRITVKGYYYTYDNPAKKVAFEKTVTVDFKVEPAKIDFSAFTGVTVLNSVYFYNASKNYAVLMVKLVPPLGFAKAVKLQFSVTTEGVATPLKGIQQEIVAVNGEVNQSEVFSVFESHEKSPEATIVVPENNTVVTLLIKMDKMPLNTSVGEIISGKFYLVTKLIGAEASNGVWVTSNKEIVMKQLVGVNGAVDVANLGHSCGCNNNSCSVNLKGIIVGISEVYTVSNPRSMLEGVIYLAYPYPNDSNQTVRVTVSLPGDLKFLVSTIPLTLTQVLGAISENKMVTGNATLYLPFGGGFILHKLYVYAVPTNGVLPADLKAELTLSTQGTNGQLRVVKVAYNKVPTFEPGFVYLENTLPAVGVAKSLGGMVISPFDTPYLSWYAGANVLFNTGVPTNVSKTFYIPVTFVAPNPYGKYYVKILPIAPNEVEMKPIATLGEDTLGWKATAYYAVVKVTVSDPIGFYPIVIIVTNGKHEVVSEEKTYMNPMVLSLMNQIDLANTTNGALYSASLLDGFINEASYNYLLKKLSGYIKRTNTTKNPFYVSNGVLYTFSNGRPYYAMELGYFTFKFNRNGEVTAEFEKGFDNVSTYDKFKETMLTAKSEWDKFFGVNVLYNPADLSYIKLNPGDEERVVSVAFMLPVDRSKLKEPVKELLIENGELHYITIHPDGTLEDKLSDQNFLPVNESGYYLVVPDKGKYLVGGYEFVNTSEQFPFYEVKVIYVPNGSKYDLNKVSVFVNGKKAEVVWDKEDIATVLTKYYSFIKNAVPSVIVKPYDKFLVFDIYSPPSEPITSLEIRYGGETVFKKTITAEDVKYLTFLNFFDAGLLPDFGFYTFDWMQPALQR